MQITYLKKKKSVSTIFMSFNGKFLGDNATVVTRVHEGQQPKLLNTACMITI